MTATTTESSVITSALSVRDLDIFTEQDRQVLFGVEFDLQPGRILALVGESGSGKTTAGLACMGHFRKGLARGTGTITLGRSGTQNVLQMPQQELRALRGRHIAYVPQDPALSLNPAQRIGAQILEVLQIHGYGDSTAERRERVGQVLAEVGLKNDEAYQHRYPHQLSGGQQQRVGIAMAFACRPSVIVLDEPTTGLDVSTQALVLETIKELSERHQVAGLYITHDLAVVAELADEVAVMLRGRIVEHGSAREVLYSPQHDYTKALLDAVPDLEGCHQVGEVQAITSEQVQVQAHQIRQKLELPADAQPLLQVKNLALSYGAAKILNGINLSLDPGESMMLLGESGSGKTTLSRCVAGLNDDYTGTVALNGVELAPGTRKRTASQRQHIQYIFQSPFSSLNPRRTISESVEVPLVMAGVRSKSHRRDRVLEALDQVRLGKSYMDRRPGDLSGGERQRAAIARALVNAPSLLVCDEITSALDVSVQASILDLLRTIQAERQMSLLFVTHNIALARHISQRIAVLQQGKIVDYGHTDAVLENPQHEYTQQLLAHIPSF
ncbi:ABC transporter ATP-binding protein [Glutamicibacter uratoxydans]|uniref:ABC transporter ATP-binding protein n=1 Tax=Glutamicibacter uratoxydans TaxID=43667 RepID=A0A4Y4DMS1_GLUUR|nr:ABC transporter ATP-binding protein [Glutamicibacter uratoxydans]GED05883.1 ABC transporter ATP-binding protein [Glutamicibacter uratoxydans]